MFTLYLVFIVLFTSRTSRLFSPHTLIYILKNIDFGIGNNAFLYRTVGTSNTDIAVYGYRGAIDNTMTEFTIPNTIDGYTVTAIGASAFEGCFTSSLTPNLKVVNIPATLTEIANKAFAGCTSLTAIKYAENSQLSKIGEYSFYGCKNLNQFGNTANKIVCPVQMQYIGRMAFGYVDDVAEVYISSGVNNIAVNAFALMHGLTQITVDSANSHYFHDTNGILYSADSIIEL